jgi:DNA-binding CsgD family transcriptional regulator
MAMPLPEQSTFLNAVEKVYETALYDDRWSSSLDAIANIFGAVGVSFEIFESATNQPIAIELGSELCVPAAQVYMDYYGRISPRVKYNNGKPSGFVSYDHMILTESEMDRDEYYADCMAPAGLRYFLAVQVFCSASHQAVFAAQRSPSQGHVGDAEIATLKRLLPHLQQATDLRFRLTAAQIVGGQDLEGLEHLNEACLTIDKTGKALHVNSAAAEIFSRNDGVALQNSRLNFGDKLAAHWFGNALARLDSVDGEDLTERDFSVRRSSGKRPYLIAIRALPRLNEFTPYAEPAAAMVFLRDPEYYTRINSDLLKRSYGLSAAETELAAALDRGLTLHDVANERGVSITTVRTQLYALMAKLNVNRQTDLARLLTRYRQLFA